MSTLTRKDNTDTSKLDTQKILVRFHALHDYLKIVDYKGWEYDDLLASKFVSAFTFNSLWLKIIAVQLAKRSPFNLRPLLGVPKLHSTKAFAFISKGYLLHDMVHNNHSYSVEIKNALDWLLANDSKGYSGRCWGNDFDFASRAGYFPRSLPTIVWTSHIQDAFDLAYQHTGNEEYKEVVISIAEFIISDLERIEDGSGFCFAYAPGILFPIHNSNLLGVAALLRAYKLTKDDRFLTTAKKACDWSVSKQNGDGSWYYGDKEMLHWVDNYHTGYNLDCLLCAHQIAGEGFVSMDVIRKTYDYWVGNLFDEDMAPKFYNNNSFPRDIQATAQAIESFCKYSVIDPSAYDHAVKVFEWACGNMLRDNGSFAYRLYKNGSRNDLEAIHWGQATMLSAMGHLLYYCATKNR
jgi:hypothetical protein